MIHPWSELCFLLILALSLRSSAVGSVQAEPRPLPSLPLSAGLRKQQQQQEAKDEEETEDEKQRGLTTLNPLKPPSCPASLPSAAAAPPAAQTCKMESVVEQRRLVEGVEEVEEDRQRNVNVEVRKRPFWMDDDDLPPMM